MDVPVLAVPVTPLNCMALAMWIPVFFPTDLQAGALAAQDILQTEVDAVTATRATLGLGPLPWYFLVFGHRSSHAPPRQEGPPLRCLLPSLQMSYAHIL